MAETPDTHMGGADPRSRTPLGKRQDAEKWLSLGSQDAETACPDCAKPIAAPGASTGAHKDWCTCSPGSPAACTSDPYMTQVEQSPGQGGDFSPVPELPTKGKGPAATSQETHGKGAGEGRPCEIAECDPVRMVFGN